MLTREQMELVNKAHNLQIKIDKDKAELDAIKDRLKKECGECKETVTVGRAKFTLSIIRTKEGMGVDTAKVKATAGWQEKYGKPTGGDLRLTIK